MTNTTQVPTNGFSLPGSGTAPQVPQGGAPALPAEPQGNPVVAPGQRPGWVVPPMPQGQGHSSQTEVPQQGQGQQALQGGDLQAVLAAFLAAQGAPAPGAVPAAAPAAPSNVPAWVPPALNTFNLSQVDDPIIQSMGGMLQVVGKDLDLNRVLGNALAHGDPNLVDVAYIAEKGGANAQQIASIARNIAQAVVAKQDAIQGEVHQLAGGEAQWNASAAVFNQSAPAELKMAVKHMLDSRDSKSIKAGAMLVTQFGRASGRLPQQGASLLNGASAGFGAAQGLSKSNFKIELGRLNTRDPGYQEARESLYQRRSIGRASGL